MTAFSLVMLGKLFFLVVFVIFFAVVASTSESSGFYLFKKKNLLFFFRLLRQMSTRCSSPKAFWREERSHSPSDAGIMTD